MYLRRKMFGMATPSEMQRMMRAELMPLDTACVTSPMTPCMLMRPSRPRYISTPGIMGMTDGMVSTWLGTWNQWTAFSAMRLTTSAPMNEPMTGP